MFRFSAFEDSYRRPTTRINTQNDVAMLAIMSAQVPIYA